MRIYDGIEFFAKKKNTKVIIRHGKESLTFGEFKKLSDDISYYFRERYSFGSKIIVRSDSPIKGLLILIGASKAGLQSILMDSTYPREQINKIINDEGIKVITNEMELFQEISNLNDDGELIDIPEEVEKKDLFLGVLSSGSTGTPKVIWRSHESWTEAFKKENDIFRIEREDMFFIGGSLVYSANLNMVLHVINQGGTIVFSSSIFPRSWIKDIETNKVTGLFLVPANYRILIKNISLPIEKIRILISAGEKMDINTLKGIKDLFPSSNFYEYYGASELGHITYASMEDLLSKPGTVGKSFPGVNLKIQDGKIWVKSPYIAPLFGPWGTVNDLGFLDQEGFLFLEGREGRIINKGGIKIHPEDLEKIISTFPGVDEVVVLGVKDSLKGEVPVAFVKRENEEINAADIIKFLKEKINNNAIPRRIIFLETIPKNNFGKIHFKNLKSMI